MQLRPVGGGEHLAELRFVPMQSEGLAYTLRGLVDRLQNVLAPGLERRTELAVEFVFTEARGGVQLYWQDTRRGTVQKQKFL
jgi:hypothetical protein